MLYIVLRSTQYILGCNNRQTKECTSRHGRQRSPAVPATAWKWRWNWSTSRNLPRTVPPAARCSCRWDGPTRGRSRTPGGGVGQKVQEGTPKKNYASPPGVRPPQLKLRVRSQSFQLISFRKVGQLPLLSSALRWRISAESGAKGLVVPLQGEPEVPDGQVGAKQLAIEGTISVLCYGEFLGEEGQGELPVPPHLLLQGAAPKWVAGASVTTDRGDRGFGWERATTRARYSAPPRRGGQQKGGGWALEAVAGDRGLWPTQTPWGGRNPGGDCRGGTQGRRWPPRYRRGKWREVQPGPHAVHEAALEGVSLIPLIPHLKLHKNKLPQAELIGDGGLKNVGGDAYSLGSNPSPDQSGKTQSYH